MLCERCGKELPVDALTCPNCGTATRAAQSVPSGYPSQQSGYMPPPQSGYVPPPQPGPGYMPPPQPGPGYTPPPQQSGYMPPPQPGYGGYAPQQPGNAYGQQPQPGYGYGQGVNVTVVNTANTTNNTPLILEVILSLFGIYGVGWLMAGETTVGIILLIGSLFYWAVDFVLAITVVGLCLLVPLVIATIVTNAILLSKTLKRKASQVVMVQTR